MSESVSPEILLEMMEDLVSAADKFKRIGLPVRVYFGDVPVQEGAQTAKRGPGRPPKAPQAKRQSYDPKPCPVCGTPNKRRGSAFLCENHDSPENRAKFKKGAVAQAPKAKATKPAATVAKAAAKKPGRPKGSKNKRKAAVAPASAAA